MIKEVVKVGRSAWRKRCPCGVVSRVGQLPVQCRCGRYLSRQGGDWMWIHVNSEAIKMASIRLLRETLRPLFFVTLLLLLALSGCVVVDDGRPGSPFRFVATSVTVRVDSLNEGSSFRYHEHEWSYSPVSFVSEARLPALPDGERWTERSRERICRICLRHEWQAEKIVSQKPAVSEFDSLRARLAIQ